MDRPTLPRWVGGKGPDTLVTSEKGDSGLEGRGTLRRRRQNGWGPRPMKYEDTEG